MRRLFAVLTASVLFCLSTPAFADEAKFAFGGDQYSAGQTTTIDAPVARDAFMAGYNVSLSAPVAGDAHLAGFNVTSGAGVTGNLYAAGFSVTVSGGVGGNVTAVGNSVTVKTPAAVPGNVRLAGQTVTLGSPVAGSALISAQTLTLDAAITGDLKFFGENLTFGPAAKVSGTVSIEAPKEIAVPESVASADRVSFKQLIAPDYSSEAGKTAENVVKGFWPVFWVAAAWWLLLLLVGAAFIALLPRGVAAMQLVAEKRPFRNIGLGILAFASVLGLVPLFAITLFGILLLPFVFLFVAIALSLAYIAGSFFAGLRLARAFVPIETNLHKVAVLAVSLVVAALLGMIPVIGWFIVLLLVTFGFGIMAMVLMVRWSARDAARLQAASAAAPEAA